MPSATTRWARLVAFEGVNLARSKRVSSGMTTKYSASIAWNHPRSAGATSEKKKIGSYYPGSRADTEESLDRTQWLFAWQESDRNDVEHLYREGSATTARMLRFGILKHESLLHERFFVIHRHVLQVHEALRIDE